MAYHDHHGYRRDDYAPLDDADLDVVDASTPPPTASTGPDAPTAAPEPDADQLALLDRMIAEPFLDLSGTAGVGKTFVARLLAERADGVELCATTGIAAVNLGEGRTINSLLGYYDTADLRDKYIDGRLASTLRRLARAGLRKILLDEKSMLSGHQLTYLVRAIDDANSPRTLETVGTGADGDDTGETPAGDLPPQIGLILVGDFGQLPPVKEPFAFESIMWDGRFAASRARLTTIRRQTDHAFVQALHAVRQGDAQTAVDAFIGFNVFEPRLDETFDGTTIFAKNDAVDRYNQLRLDGIREPVFSVKAIRQGEQLADWKTIPPALDLKVGALVMVLANRTVAAGVDVDARPRPELLYANGDLGHVIDKRAGALGPTVVVRLLRNGRVVPVDLITRDNLQPLAPGRRKELRESGQGDKIREKYECVGSITYMPLRLAYGTTVHKSQGLSLDNVQISLSDHFIGKPSMLFVALSRARSVRGLRVIGSPSLFVRRIAVDPQVQPWL